MLTGLVHGDVAILQAINGPLDAVGTTVKKLEALVESIKELENELKEAQYDYYRIVADLLTDVKEQMANFQIYAAVPQVILIQAKITAIETELHRQVQWSCREIGPLLSSDAKSGDPEAPAAAESTIDLQELSQVYLIVDVLGKPFRKDLLDRFAQLQLIPYEKMFKQGSRLGIDGLEHVEKRFSWFKRLLQVADTRLGEIFPQSWNLGYHLFCEFSRRTRNHLVCALEELEKSRRVDQQTHVAMLLRALKIVIAFETEMKGLLQMRTRDPEVDPPDAVIEYLAPPSINDAFDAYLGPYVQMERANLEQMMEGLMREEDALLKDEKAILAHCKEPYGSSQKMFEFIKASLKRCTAFSTGRTYLQLSKEFRICLHHFAESMRFRCPSPVVAKAGQHPLYNITPIGELMMARIVTTGEYCIDTVPQLEGMMKKHINPSLADEIDFSAQIDAFMDMVNFTYGIISTGILERLDPAMKTLRKLNLAFTETVGDEGHYVKLINKELNATIPRVRMGMSPVYFQSFCMKLLTAVFDKVLENIWKMKRMSKAGAGQLLMDVNGFKEQFLRMPNARLKPGEEPMTISKAYNNLVYTRASGVERVLKLVCTEDDMLEETFALLWPDGTKDDLEAVKNLKGTGNAALDEIKNVANQVGVDKAGKEIKQGVKDATEELKDFGRFVKDDIKNIFTGKLFDDPSIHARPAQAPRPAANGAGGAGGAGGASSGHRPAPQRVAPAAGTSKSGDMAGRALGDIKSAFGSFGSIGKSFDMFGSDSAAASGAKKPTQKPS